MKSLFEVIIDDELKKMFTWTGKTEKMEFRTYKEVIALLFAVIRLADSNYTIAQCHKDIIYRVLKRKNQNQNQKQETERFVRILCKSFTLSLNYQCCCSFIRWSFICNIFYCSIIQKPINQHAIVIKLLCNRIHFSLWLDISVFAIHLFNDFFKMNFDSFSSYFPLLCVSILLILFDIFLSNFSHMENGDSTSTIDCDLNLFDGNLKDDQKPSTSSDNSCNADEKLVATIFKLLNRCK